MAIEEKVKTAVRIFRHVTGKPDFSPSDAMQWAGLPAELAGTDTYKATFKSYQMHFEQKHGPPQDKDDKESMSNRFRYLWHNTVVEPEGTKKKTQALVMEMAGSKENSAGAFYMKCSRLKAPNKGAETMPVDIDPIYATDSLNDSWCADVSPVSGSQGRGPFGESPHVVPQGRDTFRPPMLRRSLSLNGLSQQIMSPLSTGVSNQSSPSSAVSHPSSTIDNDMICISIPLNDALKDIVKDAVEERVAVALALEAESAVISTGTIAGSRGRIGLQNKRQDMAKAVQRLTTVPESRLTSKARQAQRQADETLRDIKNTGYKVGTLLLDCVIKQLAPLNHLDTKDKVAEAINGLFRVELVSGKSR